MSEPDDALREMARNRGCRLVKSRRRKPGGDFGRYGLKDLGSGREVYGFGAKGLTASPEDIAAFLRGGAVANWRSSLDAAPANKKDSPSRPGAARSAGAARSSKSPGASRPSAPGKPAAARPAKVAPPLPPPAPVIRDARPRDARAIAEMVVALGHQATEGSIRRDIPRFAKAGTPLLVADLDGPAGVLTFHVTPVVHRFKPVGRITMLVVTEKRRGQGLGSALVAEAEARLAKAGCGLIEVTSNMKRMRAHVFYEELGYERTSYRFFKKLTD